MPDFNGLRRYVTLPGRKRARIVRDVDSELETHLAMRAEALERQGATRDDARAQALREFGDLADARQYCVEVSRRTDRRAKWRDWLSDARLDAGHAVRLMRRSPAFSAATIAVFAAAIAASTAANSVLRAYLIRPLPFPESDRLMSIVPGPSLAVFPRSPSLQHVDWKRVDSLFEVTAAWDLDGFTLPDGSRPDYIDGAWVSPGFSKAMGITPAIGRDFTADDFAKHAPVALISDALWERRYGRDPRIVGTTVTMASTDRPREQTRVTIVGVLPRTFWHLNRFTDLLRPLPDESRMPSLARLQRGMSMAEGEAKLDAVVRAQLSGVDPGWRMSLMSASEEHAANIRPILVAISGAALLMLLAACGSVAGGLVGRMVSRRQELAIRTALGGTSGRIGRQLLTESVILATIAGTIGVVAARILLVAIGPLIERQLGATVPGGAMALAPDMTAMVGAIAFSAMTGVLCGLVPALAFLRRDQRASGATLRPGHGSGRAAGTRVRQTLIWCELSLAVVLLFGAGLMARTVAHLQTVELGFHSNGVIKATVLLPSDRYGDSTARREGMSRLLASIRDVPGVRDAAAVFPYPFRGAPPASVVREGALEPGSAIPAVSYTVSDHYFSTMEIALASGRAFDARDDGRSALVTIVSARLATRLWGATDPIGRRIRIGGDAQPGREVVGVARDVRNTLDDDGPAAENVYLPYAQNPRAYQSFVVRAGDAQVGDAMRRAVAAVDPNLALSEVEPLDDVVARQRAPRRGLAILLGAFSVFALVLAALGLYTSLSYLVEQRRLEFAVRMAVGAESAAIVGLVMAEGVAPVVAALVTGTALSLAFGRVLEHQVFGVDTSDLPTLIAIAAVLVGAAGAAMVLPAWKATKTNPAIALRG